MFMMSYHAGRIWRRRLFRLISVLSVVLVAATQALAGEYLVYVGTYTGQGSEGIYAFRFNPDTGETGPVDLVAATDNPSFLAIDPTASFLYAVNEVDAFHGEPTGAISVFAIDRESGELKLLQQVSSLGGAPAHVSLDRSARYLMVANYNGGSVAVFPIENDGRLGRHSSFMQHAGSSVNPQRQAGPHAHFIQVTNDNRFAVAADLGLDKLLVYRFDPNNGSLTPANPGFVETGAGAGPRHVAFAPSGKFIYAVNELASTVTVFAYKPVTGSLHAIQTVPSLPENFAGNNTAAEIVVDATGGFLYVSNRGHDSIAVYSINPETGKLSSPEWVPSGGKTPRNFVIDPTGKWLIAANQDSNNIQLFKIDQSNGRLLATSRSLKVVSPVCMRIVAFQ